MNTSKKRHPRWLKVPLPAGKNYHEIRQLLKHQHLHTVCESAHCPNIGECWNNRTATFMILGNKCTRNCGFCAVNSSAPDEVDWYEPIRVAEAVKRLNLMYVVITSVTRDDLTDGGAIIFAKTIEQIRKEIPTCKVEVLIPDFEGKQSSLDMVISTAPDVINHNIETVPRLYERVRPQANYARSLNLLKRVKEAGMITKSGLMLGLGETDEEVVQVMNDLRVIQCDFLTIGQYLQPSSRHLPIARYLHPGEFDNFQKKGYDMGFSHIEAGPLVRSSYHAAAQPFNT